MTHSNGRNCRVTIAASVCFTLAGLGASAQSLAVSGPAVTPKFVPGNGAPSKVGIFRSGVQWLLDVDGNRQWNSPPDRAFNYGGDAGDIAIAGDWNGDGYTKVGIYRPNTGIEPPITAPPGSFILDNGGQNAQEGQVYSFLSSVGGPQPGDIPVVGDWNGDGRTKVGIFRQGFFWILDYNGDGVFEQGTDKTYAFGGIAGDVPVVGDWTGTGTSKIGILRDGFFWILDANGNGSFDGTGPGEDLAFAFGGIAGDVPIVGDWTGDGVSKVGMFREGFFWVLDANDPSLNGGGPAPLIAFAFGGIAGDVPVVGNWFSPPAMITATSGSPQSTNVNTAFPAPLVATAIGYDGFGVSGITIVFAPNPAGNGASATFAGGIHINQETTDVTNASGVATTGGVLANGIAGGPYSVEASAFSCQPYPGCPGLVTGTFSLTNTAGPAQSLPQRPPAH